MLAKIHDDRRCEATHHEERVIFSAHQATEGLGRALSLVGRNNTGGNSTPEIHNELSDDELDPTVLAQAGLTPSILYTLLQYFPPPAENYYSGGL